MSTLGWVHVVFGLVALLVGSVVVLARKGTRWHRTLGHVFLTSMVGLNATALFIYNLYGRIGPFHWLALVSLVTLTTGMIPVITRRPRGRWLEWHAIFINAAYIGLVAATAAEITSRIPGAEGSFGLVVGATSAAIIAGGALLLRNKLSQSTRWAHVGSGRGQQ